MAAECGCSNTLAASSNAFTLHNPVTLTLSFDLILIGGQGIMMHYLCARDFTFSHFGFIM